MTGNFTITMWINGDDDNESISLQCILLVKKLIQIIKSDVNGSNKLRILSNNNNNAKAFGDSNPIINGQWYHVAAVHDDSNNWTLYKNGVSVVTGVAGATWQQLRLESIAKNKSLGKATLMNIKSSVEPLMEMRSLMPVCSMKSVKNL